MGLLSSLLLLPVTGPARGLRFILDRIAEQADAEALDEGRVQGDLLDLNLRLDRREISDEEFAKREADLLAELNAIRAYKESFAAPYGPDEPDDVELEDAGGDDT